MPSRFSPKTISLSFGILVLLFSLSFIAFAWTEPTLLPPSGNADSPLNVGTTAQTKNARLSVTELYDANDSTYYLNPNGQSVLSGPLGIGITGPATPLHVSGASITGGDSRFNLRLDDTAAFAAGVGAGIQFVGKIDAVGTLNGFASIKGIKENGTSGNPSGALSLITSSNTGANVERMRIDSAGNVGIGITPIEKLTVATSNAELLSLRNTAVAAVTNMAYVYFGMKDSAANDDYFGAIAGKSTGITNGSENGSLAFSVKNSGAWNQVLYIQNDGSVGIGNSSPATALDLNGALTIRAIAAPSVSPLSQGRIYFDSTANVFKVSENGGAYVNLVGGSSQWTTSGSNIYYNTGNVGIGTTTPGWKLHLRGVDPYIALQRNADTQANGILFQNSVGTTDASTWDISERGSGEGNQFAFANYPGGIFTKRLVIDTAGNVGIGTTTPGAMLEVYKNTPSAYTGLKITNADGSAATGGAIDFYVGGTVLGGKIEVQNDGASGETMRLYTRNDGAGAATEKVRILNNGNVGIGTTGPGQKLEVSGDVLATDYRVVAANGNGICFWNDCTNYKIHMGTGAEYQYGPVTDYSIKMNMNSGASTRGWTWGYTGTAPIAAISGGGNMQIAGNFVSMGNVGIGTTTPSSKLTVAGTIESTGFKLTTSPSVGYVLTSDASGGGTWQAAAGVPSGTSITTTSPYPPSGYTYTGNFTAVQPDSNDDGDYWMTKTAMPTVRGYTTAASVNNKIYVIGGYNATSGYLNTNEEYDPTNNAWTTKTVMPTARTGTAASVNNKIYVISGGISGGFTNVNEEYDPSTNTWATKTAITTARDQFAAAVVNNKIYAIGGYIFGGTTNVNQEYDPAVGAGGTWTSKTAMPTARAEIAGASVNNKIYVLGGRPDYSATGLTTNEEYDPSTNSWTSKAGMLTGRRGLGAASVNNKIYAIGGLAAGISRFNVNEEYDPSTNIWVTMTGMPTARSNFGISTVFNNRIYTIGGADSSGGYPSTNEEYKVAAVNVWRAKTVLPTARHSPAVAVVNNKLYAIGGNNGTVQVGTNEEYNPATNSWATKTAMPTVREQAAATAVNGIIYVVGGWNGGPITNNEAYNPLADTWTGKTSMQARRYGLAAVTVRDKIYAIGGATWCGPYNDWCGSGANEEYNPYTNTWVYKTGVPGSYSCAASQANLAAAVANNKIYAVGGDGGASANPNTCIQGFNNEYDPLFDTWTVKAGMRYARKYLAAASVNNKIYAIGGWNNGTRYDQMEEYDPVTNTWTNKKSMSSQRYLPGAGVVYNKIYVVGGYTTNVLNNNDEYTPPSTFYYIHTKN